MLNEWVSEWTHCRKWEENLVVGMWWSSLSGEKHNDVPDVEETWLSALEGSLPPVEEKEGHLIWPTSLGGHRWQIQSPLHREVYTPTLMATALQWLSHIIQSQTMEMLNRFVICRPATAENDSVQQKPPKLKMCRLVLQLPETFCEITAFISAAFTPWSWFHLYSTCCHTLTFRACLMDGMWRRW